VAEDGEKEAAARVEVGEASQDKVKAALLEVCNSRGMKREVQQLYQLDNLRRHIHSNRDHLQLKQ
jgi:hypothetical protein